VARPQRRIEPIRGRQGALDDEKIVGEIDQIPLSSAENTSNPYLRFPTRMFSFSEC